MARTCIFCGASPLTNEHVLPQWLHTAFPFPDNRALHVRESHTNQHARAGLLLDAKARIVCAQCNGGWMNGLEAGVRPFLPRMIRGKQTMLGAKRQGALATWCVKTAMMLQCTHPRQDQQAIPAEDYLSLFRQRQPNTMTTAWAGYLQHIPRPKENVESPVEFIGLPLRRDVKQRTEQGTEVLPDNAFATTMRLNHFVAQVIRIGPAEFPMKLTPVKLRPYLVSLWPPADVRKWPPLAVEGVGGFHVLAGALTADGQAATGPNLSAWPHD